MSQPEAIQDTDETPQIDQSMRTSSPILDSSTVASPSDFGLNLSANEPRAGSPKPQARRRSASPPKEDRPALSGRLRSRKVRMLLMVLSLLLIVGLIGLNVNRQPIVTESEVDSDSLDLSEMSESNSGVLTSDTPDEPRRHEFEAQFEDHPLMRNAAQSRSATVWQVESDWPATDARSGIVPVTNFTDGPLPVTASQPRRAPASGSQGAWLTGQIESDDSPKSTMLRTSAANQAAPRQLPRARHPLAD